MYVNIAVGRATWLVRHLHLIDSLVLAPPLLQERDFFMRGNLLPTYSVGEEERVKQDYRSTMEALRGASRLQVTHVPQDKQFSKLLCVQIISDRLRILAR